MYQKLRSHLTRRNLIVAGSLLLILYASISTLRVISRNYELQQDVDRLMAEIEVLKLQTQELDYQVAYYRTDAFAEKEGRDKLGLQASGENVVVLPDKIPRGVDDGIPDQADQTAAQVALSNFEQWLYFLFKKEPSG
jgi:cell division protein FtsB